jgi:hypothetical protein
MHYATGLVEIRRQNKWSAATWVSALCARVYMFVDFLCVCSNMADQLLIRRQCTFSMLPASPSVDSSAQWKLKFTMPFICDTARFAFTQHCMRSLNSQKSACGKMSNWSSRKFHFGARALYKVEINCCAPEKGSKWKSRNVLSSLNRNPKCNLQAYIQKRPGGTRQIDAPPKTQFPIYLPFAKCDFSWCANGRRLRTLSSGTKVDTDPPLRYQQRIK